MVLEQEHASCALVLYGIWRGSASFTCTWALLCCCAETVGHTPSSVLPLFPDIFPSAHLRVGSLPLPHGLLLSLLVPVAFGGAAESSHICTTSLSVLGSDPLLPLWVANLVFCFPSSQVCLGSAFVEENCLGKTQLCASPRVQIL